MIPAVIIQWKQIRMNAIDWEFTVFQTALARQVGPSTAFAWYEARIRGIDRITDEEITEALARAHKRV